MALKRSASLAADAMHPLSWQDVYRQLSALAVELEGIADQGEGVDSPLGKGSRFLLDTLDDALNARMAMPPPCSAAALPAPSSPPAGAGGFPGSLSAGSLGYFDIDEGALADALDSFIAADVAGLEFDALETAAGWGTSGAV